MSELAVIPLARIRPNLNQVRRTFHRIDELARSIAQYGLLQNLVVRPLPEAGYYEIVAGERRYRALTLLAKDGRLEPAEVRCFVISGDGSYKNIIENVVREDVPVWEVGLCIFDEKALRRWKEIEVPKEVTRQTVHGGFLDEFASSDS